jgi:hypothetical protein
MGLKKPAQKHWPNSDAQKAFIARVADVKNPVT